MSGSKPGRPLTPWQEEQRARSKLALPLVIISGEDFTSGGIYCRHPAPIPTGVHDTIDNYW